MTLTGLGITGPASVSIIDYTHRSRSSQTCTTVGLAQYCTVLGHPSCQPASQPIWAGWLAGPSLAQTCPALAQTCPALAHLHGHIKGFGLSTGQPWLGQPMGWPSWDPKIAQNSPFWAILGYFGP